MTKEEVYKELDEVWKLFSMTNKEIENAYYEITGQCKEDEQTILDLKEYLLEYVLDRMIYDEDLDYISAGKIFGEILETWK